MTPQDDNTPQAQTKLCLSRQCELLGVPQPVENFYKNSSTKDGFQDFCKKCMTRVRKQSPSEKYQRIPYVYADDGTKLKVCTQCLVPKSFDEFSKNDHCRDGLSPRCKLCCNKSGQEQYRNDRIRRLEVSSAWAAKNKEIRREKNRINLEQYLKFIENGGEEKTKVCTRCKGDPQPLSNFNIHLMHSDGHSSQCNKCCKEVSSLWYEENKEAALEYDRKRRRGRWPIRTLRSCRRRAEKKNIPFDLDESDLYDPSTGELPLRCPIFPSVVLDYDAGPDRRRWASVDRIVPELGYVKGNICIISNGANIWKSNGSSPEERRRIIQIISGPQKIKRKGGGDQEQGTLFDF